MTAARAAFALLSGAYFSVLVLNLTTAMQIHSLRPLAAVAITTALYGFYVALFLRARDRHIHNLYTATRRTR